MIVNVLIMV